jgi:hypothetical protein
MQFNLSEWALKHRSFVVYLMLVVTIAGVMPSRPREFHPEPLTDSVREPLDSYGSCHRAKAAAFR